MNLSQFISRSKQTLHLIAEDIKDTHLSSHLSLPYLTSESILQCPITFFSDYKELIEKHYQGQKNVITHDSIASFLLSGGTSGSTKKMGILTDQMSESFFPLVKWVRKIKENILHLPKWNSLHLLFSSPVISTQLHIRVGLLSTFWFDTVSELYSSEPGGRSVHYAEDLDTYLHAQIREAINHPELHEIYAPFPYILLRFFQLAEELTSISCNILWPNLTLVTCVFQGSFRCYVDRIKKYLPNCTCYDPLLGSTEAFYFAVNLSSNEQGLFMLNPYSSYYEFIHTNTKKIYPIEQLESNQEYTLIVTNLNGYVRYNTNDILKVKEIRDGLPLFELSSREAVLNILNERVTESVLESFWKQYLSLTYITFLASVVLHPISHYEIIVVLSNKHTNIDIHSVTERFDSFLCEQYILYQSGRKKNIISSPIVIISSEDRFDELMLEKASQNLQAKYNRILTLELFLYWKEKVQLKENLVKENEQDS